MTRDRAWMEDTEADLVAKARSGNLFAFEEIVRRHERRVYAVAYRIVRRHDVADDVVQEAFLRAYRSLDRFDTARPFGPWIARIAANLALSHMRSGLAFCLAAFAASAAKPVTAAGPERVVFPSLDGPIVADRLITGLSQPSAIESLPGGKALVMQRFVGLLSLVDFASGTVRNVEGMQNTLVSESGGAHDIELHPDFASNGWIYLSYSEGKQGQSSTVVDRIRLDGTQVVAQERIFTADAYAEAAYGIPGAHGVR